MKNILRLLVPPPQWRLPVILLVGVMVGLGALVVRVSNAVSYFSDTPETCMNCHVMAPQFATWQRGSHGRVTTCNDCHVPHDNFVSTYAFKAKDGMRHASMFTLRLEPQVIQIKEAGIDVVQENCKRCHADLIHFSSLTEMTGPGSRYGEDVLCWHCHREVPHGRVNSLASTPSARVPIPSRITPDS
ncbi:MAG: cytochrome c nitrite reductase small subunit [Ignavibacteria bacterium]|nr:cytochrome c nitrite reductase small subunit [Ignavibacteria bacterium]